MRLGRPVATHVTWAQVHAFRLSRHHLAGRAPKRALVEVTRDIGGAQAQLMSAAELQLCTRVRTSVQDVRDALWRDRRLVKTWLMRGTLHLVPARDLPLYTAAMRTRWIRTSSSWLKFVQMTEPELLKVTERVADVIGDEPRTREEVIALAGKGQPESVLIALRSGWGGLLKPAARRGLLCFGPNRGQSVTFVRPEAWLGSWSELDPDASLIEMARRYLRAYGPATRQDFARWWGNWSGAAAAAWDGLGAELATVSVEGSSADLLLADLESLTATPRLDSVQLLPAFDPYLMGYASRSHMFDAVHAPRVSRTAGWISAVVLRDGRVAGTWTHEVRGGSLRVVVEPFESLPAKVMTRVQERSEELALALGLDGSEVRSSQARNDSPRLAGGRRVTRS